MLRLKAFDPLDADPGAADRGLIIHDALANFLRAYPKQLPADAMGRLLVIGKESFGTALARPGVWAFWWPRFRRIAEWVVAQETLRRSHLEEIFSEISGTFTFDGPAGKFELTGRADRIERRRDGTIAIIERHLRQKIAQ